VDSLPALVQSGRIPMAQVDEAVRRILREKFRLRLFDDPYRAMPPVEPDKALARRAAQESIVLLKNDGGLLPIAATAKTIAVIGPLAADTVNPLGPWSGKSRPSDVVSVLAGVQGRARAPATARPGA